MYLHATGGVKQKSNLGTKNGPSSALACLPAQTPQARLALAIALRKCQSGNRGARVLMSLVAGGGLGLLIGLGVLVGQRQTQEVAWRRIAMERRELDQWERELIAAAEGRGCSACRLRRQDGES